MVPSTLRSGRAPRGSGAVAEGDVHQHGARLHGRIDAGDVAGGDPVAGIHVGGLARLDVPRLGFGDLDLRLEPGGIGDAGDVGARRDALADFHGHELEHARHAGAHLEGVELPVA